MSESLELHLARDLEISYDVAAEALRAGPAR